MWYCMLYILCVCAGEGNYAHGGITSSLQQGSLVPPSMQEPRSASPTKDGLPENNRVIYDQSHFSKKDNIITLARHVRRQDLWCAMKITVEKKRSKSTERNVPWHGEQPSDVRGWGIAGEEHFCLCMRRGCESRELKYNLHQESNWDNVLTFSLEYGMVIK